MFTSDEIVRLNNSWIAIIFIAILIILVVLHIFFGKRLARTNKMLLSKSYVQTYYNKDKNKFFTPFSWLLFIVQILTISLLAYAFIVQFGFKKEVTNIKLYLLILEITGFYFLIRYVVGFLLANLFDIKELFLSSPLKK